MNKKQRKSEILAGIACTLVLFGSTRADAAHVAVFGDRFNLSTINNFYGSLSGHTSTIIGSLTDSDLAGVSLLWAVQPASSYSTGQLGAMSNFLTGGGRIAFLGEHGTFAPNENNRISAAIATLGGSISIVNSLLDPGFQDATRLDGQILTHPLTTGVNVYNYAAFAPLTLSGTAEALMLGADQSSVMMGYQNIGSGSIFLITDQNVWDHVGASTNDNAVMFENLLTGDTGAPPPNPVPDGGSSLLMSTAALAALFGSKRFLNSRKRA